MAGSQAVGVMSPSPFEILGVPADADDERIRAAYLRQVREHPPERDPEAFRRIHRAYEAVRDARARIAYRLFHVPDWRTIAASVPERPTPAQFQAMLRACAERMSEADG